MQRIDRLVLCDNKVLQQLTQALKQYFFMLQKRHLERRIISKHEDIHCSQRSPCRPTEPTHAGFFRLPRRQGLEQGLEHVKAWQSCMLYQISSLSRDMISHDLIYDSL